MPVEDMGQVSGGKKRVTGSIDIGLLQSLNRKGEVKDLVAGYGQVIVDECHHIPAITFEQVLKQVMQVYDYADIHVPTLMRMYKKRLKGYEAIGYMMQNSPENSRQQTNEYKNRRVEEV
jgi:hypothetical protein